VQAARQRISVRPPRRTETAKGRSDKDRITSGRRVNCWICETVFRRKRETKRYCRVCKPGDAKGEYSK
jgi:hypothetical protein